MSPRPLLALALLPLAAAAQPTARRQPRLDPCPAAAFWSARGSAPAASQAAAVTYHALSDMWRLDTASTKRDLAAYLQANRAILDTVRVAVSLCGAGEQCRGCPKPPRVLWGPSYRTPSSLLTYAFQSNWSGAYAGLALFFSERPRSLPPGRAR